MKKVIILVLTTLLIGSYALAEEVIETPDAKPAPAVEAPKPAPTPRGVITITIRYDNLPLDAVAPLQTAASKVFTGATIQYTVDPK